MLENVGISAGSSGEHGERLRGRAAHSFDGILSKPTRSPKIPSTRKCLFSIPVLAPSANGAPGDQSRQRERESMDEATGVSCGAYVPLVSQTWVRAGQRDMSFAATDKFAAGGAHMMCWTPSKAWA